jgi:hypothetical protein
MSKKSFILIVILASVWIMNASLVRGASNLTMELFIQNLPYPTDEPFSLEVLIRNPDSVAHSFQLSAFFSSSSGYWSEFGYIDANGEQDVSLTVIVDGPARTQTLTFRLYQDSRNEVDEKALNMSFYDGYLQTQISDMVQQMAQQISSLQAQVNSLILTLTAISIGVVVSAALAIVTWLITRKRKTDGTAPKPDAPHNQTH